MKDRNNGQQLIQILLKLLDNKENVKINLKNCKEQKNVLKT